MFQTQCPQTIRGRWAAAPPRSTSSTRSHPTARPFTTPHFSTSYATWPARLSVGASISGPEQGGVLAEALALADSPLRAVQATWNLCEQSAPDAGDPVADIGVEGAYGAMGPGCSPNARQIRDTADCDIPNPAASERVDQCAASRGVLSNVRVITASTCSSATVRGRPGRGSSSSPSNQSATNRARHLPTVNRPIPSRSATSVLASPSAAASTIRDLNASA